MSKSSSSWGLWGVHNPKTVMLLTFVVVIAAGWGLKSLTLVADYRVYFDKEAETLKTYEAFKETYTRDDTILIGIERKDAAPLTWDSMNIVSEVTEAAWKLPFVVRVNSASNFQRITSSQDEILVEDAFKETSREQFSELQTWYQQDIDIQGNLLTRDLTFTVLSASLEITGSYDEGIPRANREAETLVAALKKKHTDHNFYLSGGVPLNNAFAAASASDLKTLIPVMYLVVSIVAWFLLRSFFGVMAVLTLVGLSSAVGMSSLGYFGIPISPPSSAASIIIMTIAIADAIHLYSHTTHYISAGHSTAEALERSITDLMAPLFVTSFTTAIGFLALNFADSPPFRHMGNAAAVGTIAAFLFSIWTLPALLLLLPIQKFANTRLNELDFSRWSDFLARNKAWVITLFSVGVGVAIYSILTLNVDANAFRYFDRSFQFRNDTDKIVTTIGGLERLEFSLESGEEGGIFDPEFLRAADELIKEARSLKKVAFVSSPIEIFKKVNQAMLNGDDLTYRIPEDYDVAAQNFVFYEMSLPFGHELTNQVNIEKSAIRITVGLGDVSTNEQLSIANSIEHLWAGMSAKYELKGPTGISPMFAKITRSNIVSNIQGGALAYLIITITIVIMLKSLLLGALSILPNLIPCLLAIGTWGVFQNEIGLPGTVIFTLTIGIIVDDTVHFLARYKKEKETAPDQRIGAVLNGVGPALCSTSIILVAGFLVLSTSSFTGNSHVGIMSALCIIYALAADLILLPALMGRTKP